LPELPEVEVLVRHLQPLIRNKVIRKVRVFRERIIAPTSPARFKRALDGAKFTDLSRRGKYLHFRFRPRGTASEQSLVGHLGMTGRMYLTRPSDPLPKHAAVVMDLGRARFVFEDTRYFGRLTPDTSALTRLGPEPFGEEFTVKYFAEALARSRQSIKVKLLDQSLVAGVGNIYASEALYRAHVSPRLPARRLKPEQIRKLHRAIREVLTEAIRFGSTVPLNHGNNPRGDGLFYFGALPDTSNYYEERLRVYDQGGKSCRRCGGIIKRIVQAARSTFYCPDCQK
jgi:formamidopyrimidine-DNA glycosylase